jgi:hypothetical protein
MAFTAQKVLQRVVITLLDPNAIRWPTAELVRYLNDGQRDIALVRPDATSTTATLALAAGARQTLPSSGAKLLEVIRNTGGNKRAVRLVDRVILDAQNPNWYNITGVTEIKHYTFDPREPRIFYVYPPAASSNASVELIYSAYPTDITEPSGSALYTDVTGNISVADIYVNALVNYILYRAYSKDSENTQNATLAASFYQLYQSLLGTELSGTTGVAPKD